MGRLFAVLIGCLLLAACTTTTTKLASQNPVKPAPGATVLLLEPDIELSLLTAVGMQEPRADWSEQARTNMAGAVQSALQSRSHKFQPLDPDDATEGRIGQLLRLHEAVGQSIMAFDYGVYQLPNKKGTFDWTLGQGAQALGEAYDADYALFVFGRGSYSSGGRKAMMVGMALLGVSVPLGGQQAFASLVDLKTGQVVWFNVAHAAPSADMRDQAGATELVTSMLEDVPL